MSHNHEEHRSEQAVVPGIETLLSFQTFPGAACTLRHHDVEDDILRLHADDRGGVRFHVRAPRDANPVEVQLESSGSNGELETHRIVLSADASAAAAAHVPASMTAREDQQPSLPPLRQELMTVENSELIAQGYPPRPDPATAPARYARWLRIVSRPWTVVSKRLIPRPDVAFGPRPALRTPTLPLPPPIAQSMFNSNADSWSGAEYTQPFAQFFHIQAAWNVPGVLAGAPGSPLYSAAAAWIGLTADKLYQSGSDSEAYNLPSPFSNWPFNVGSWVFTNYWMWIESYPDATWVIPNIPISPGDEVEVFIFVADTDGTTWFVDGYWGGLTEADNTVWFMVYNHTKGLSYWGTLTSDLFFTGRTAAFVIERPTYNGSTAPLARFGTATMWSGWYGDSQAGYQQLFPLGSGFYDPGPTYINMESTSTKHVLDYVTAFPDPTNDGGKELVFYWLGYQ